MDVHVNFGNICRQHRLSQNYTLRSFCNKFKLDHTFISFFECNYIKPEVVLKHADHLLDAYGIPKPTDLAEVLDASYKPFDREKYFPFHGNTDIEKFRDTIQAAIDECNRRYK